MLSGIRSNLVEMSVGDFASKEVVEADQVLEGVLPLEWRLWPPMLEWNRIDNETL